MWSTEKLLGLCNWITVSKAHTVIRSTSPTSQNDVMSVSIGVSVYRDMKENVTFFYFTNLATICHACYDYATAFLGHL